MKSQPWQVAKSTLRSPPREFSLAITLNRFLPIFWVVFTDKEVMETKTTSQPKVPFTLENVMQCLCPKCPVQGKSQCVAEKKLALTTALAHNPLLHDDIPGVYCSAGQATCDGLDWSQPCSCFECSSYDKYSLAEGWPTCYYCMNGNAQ